MTTHLIPITDEQAKLGQEIIKAFSSLGSFFKEALGSVPTDLVGYLGGDWPRSRRIQNIAEHMRRTHDRLEILGVEHPHTVSLSVALPILRGAADESREELQDLWARLMAAALDPSRSGDVSHTFATIISQMDPVDSVVFDRGLDSPKGAFEFLEFQRREQGKPSTGLSWWGSCPLQTCHPPVPVLT